MSQQIQFLNMFSDYQPPEALQSALSQAAIVAADIDPETRKVDMVIHSSQYIPQRLIDQAVEDICGIYGLKSLDISATFPEDQLHNVESEELMSMFVSINSMTRGSLAGAQWTWDDNDTVFSCFGLFVVSRKGQGKKKSVC